MARETGSVAGRQTKGSLKNFANLIRGLLHDLADPYRPEMHYMRGPGPKWHAKHDQAAASFAEISGFVRIRTNS
jgi:hypothetical protein